MVKIDYFCAQIFLQQFFKGNTSSISNTYQYSLATSSYENRAQISLIGAKSGRGMG
jgi:hypothetical protein